eukprot:Plantae.Rhodophyta-Purpureofilum_apyrenoidigerum.ctg14664.p1 GENE.Plantae.Rhodophyta-Purpureofilum_apyrenoidigerum.ctg14664~~Plantae.Rhodophyta-Purpureofilum_apyrenoidigerum.ctg14664.p1  ORF type:complete len:398 (+),score=79.00 Plantae.Rhodophyta-Purpureofilum_apyrenoidigerum.ctg14664:370-1563(+)
MSYLRSLKLSGWVIKEGEKSKMFRTKNKRFFKLNGSMLSSHHDEQSPAKWEINIWGLAVYHSDKEHMIIIQHATKTVRFYVETQEAFNEWLLAVKRASARSVADFYETGEVIGNGSYGQVLKGVDRFSKEVRAIKVVKKTGNQREMEYIRREVNILRNVDHPHIIKTYDIFDLGNKYYFVLEYLPGGELFDIIAEEKHFSETNASEVMSSILKGVMYLHENNIVHRDIKPENILCKSRDWPLEVKLTDFGLSNIIMGNAQNNTLQSYVGTQYYLAPEVHRHAHYGPSVDIWSCGVILFIMLSGKFPFYGRDDVEFFARLSRGVTFPEREWNGISEEARAVVKHMLEMDPERRPTAKQLLEHPWFNGNATGDKNIHSHLQKFTSGVRGKYMANDALMN